MKLLIITCPEAIEEEAAKITRLFEEGLELLHLRKPDLGFEQYEALLKKIPPKYYKKVVIHSHFKLIEKYNLRGVHFRSRDLLEVEEENVKAVFRLAAKRSLTVSASMHSFQEIRELKWKFTYVFLSPLFDSISKEGYTSGFEPEALSEFMSGYHSPVQLVGLGGISEKNIRTVKEYGFYGAALLGTIWLEGECVERFRTIKTTMEA